LAAAAVAELSDDDQLRAAVRLAEKALRGRRAPLREILDLAGPRLLRRGFSPAVARAACARLADPGGMPPGPAAQVDPVLERV
ncbi:MAG: hypothetical protein ACREPA_03015, partial [Candidatus Dormibacteraceae bacterium]